MQTNLGRKWPELFDYRQKLKIKIGNSLCLVLLRIEWLKTKNNLTNLDVRIKKKPNCNIHLMSVIGYFVLWADNISCRL